MMGSICIVTWWQPQFKLFIIGITHLFSYINISGVPRKLFEHKADRPSAQTSLKGPSKC